MSEDVDAYHARKAGAAGEKKPPLTVVKGGAARRARQPANAEGARTHVELAAADVERLTAESGGVPPVADGGALYVFDPKSGRWRARSLDQLALHIGQRFPGEKYCRRRSDCKAIAEFEHDMCVQPGFFAGAPEGIAGPSGFHSIGDDGVVVEPLGPQHRQRFVMPAEPIRSAAKPLWDAYLARTFPEERGAEQILLLQEVFGAVLAGLMPRLQKAVLFCGKGNAGKSTALHVTEATMPDELITSTAPHRWGEEYYVANLAGKRLNVVGELSEEKPIPGHAFKQVTGGDRLEGRWPNHRPFNFYNEAAHVFNTNRPPRSSDYSQAFFRRWVCLWFEYPVPFEDVDATLAERIVSQEMSAILAWALDGAVRLKKRGRFMTTAAHDELLRKWRTQASSVLEFLHDEEVCVLEPDVLTPRDHLYDAFVKWCALARRERISRGRFYEDLEGEAGAFAGISCRRTSAGRFVSGVRVK